MSQPPSLDEYLSAKQTIEDWKKQPLVVAARKTIEEFNTAMFQVAEELLVIRLGSYEAEDFRYSTAKISEDRQTVTAVFEADTEWRQEEKEIEFPIAYLWNADLIADERIKVQQERRAKKEAEEAAAKAAQEKKDRELYERLKSKFESK